MEQSGSQAIAGKVVDCKYSVQFAYVFHTLHYVVLLYTLNVTYSTIIFIWSKWNLDDFSDIMGLLVPVLDRRCNFYLRP